MTDAVLLDSGPLGLLVHSVRLPAAAACERWAAALWAAGRRVLVPEIIDYELRRELVRLGATRSLRKLDALARTYEYLPLTTGVYRLAADLWADARRHGRPTAPNPALDIDVILAAQALTFGSPTAIATTNRKHLTRYTPAEQWDSIVP